MANVYKNIQATVNASGSDVSMYTSPDATTSIVKTIKLFNTHGSALDVTTKVFNASSSTDFEYDVSMLVLVMELIYLCLTTFSYLKQELY